VAGVIGVVLVALFSYTTLRFLIRCVSSEGGREGWQEKGEKGANEGCSLLYLLLFTFSFKCNAPLFGRSKRFLSAGVSDAAVRMREVEQQEGPEEAVTAVVVPLPLPSQGQQQHQHQQQQQQQPQRDDGLHLTYAEVGKLW